MRLLFLIPEFVGSGGGIMAFYRALAEVLCNEGIEIRVIEGSGVYATATRDKRIIDGIAIETLERARLARWWDRFPGFAALPGLRRHLAAAWAMWEQAEYGDGADVVEAADWGLLFVPPAVEASHPLVVQCHGSIGQIADHDPIAGEETETLVVRLIERSVLAIAGAVQTPGRANADFWYAETGRDVAKIYPAWRSPSRAENSAVSDRGLAVGRLQRWKGPEIICEALRRLGDRAPAVDWYGRDTVWSARHCYTSKYLARTFPDMWGTGFCYHDQVALVEVMRRQSSALFNVVPSTWDVFNFTAVQAMASGRPTIVSTGAGASELIDDGVNGFLFANGDADALVKAIQRLLNESPGRLAEIGREGRNTVYKTLDPKTIASQRLAAYRAVIDAFQKQPPSPVDGWLGAVCRPSPVVADEMAFLENLPLGALAKHVAVRITRKAWPR